MVWGSAGREARISLYNLHLPEIETDTAVERLLAYCTKRCAAYHTVLSISGGTANSISAVVEFSESRLFLK
eukprot:2043129-Rhodomonas_salina.2